MIAPETRAVEPLAYSIDDAAAAIGVSRVTIYNLVRAGNLRMVKVGHRSLIPASSLRALAELGAAA